MKRSTAIALLGTVACAIGAGIASGALSMSAHEQSLRERAVREAVLVASAYHADTKATALQLYQACARDAQVDRLALELGAGGQVEGQAAATAAGLSRAFAAPVWLLREHPRGDDGASARPGDPARTDHGGAPGVSFLAWADQSTPDERATHRPALAPSIVPAAAALRSASKQPQLLGDGTAPKLLADRSEHLMLTCGRPLGNGTLWIVRAEPLHRARLRWLPSTREVDDVAPPTTRPSAAAKLGDAVLHDSTAVDAYVLRIPTRREDTSREVWLRVHEPPSLAQLLALAPLFAALVAATGALAYVLLTRRIVGDEVLVELEQAAERVAKGDLTARIGLRPGGRADQTFRTFDRMTAELSDMRTRLADAERAAAWQDIARRIAHEIKNPLSPIRTAIETLRKAHDKQLPVFEEIFDESTRAILEEVQRMEHIVREFSEFARLPRARPGVLEVNALIADTVALYQPNDAAVEVQREPGESLACADREQIVQVLVNLLHNAADAARSAALPRVRFSVESVGELVRVHVDDNGPGIALSDRERVFEPYYTTKDHGTGLGLAIVKRIVTDHQGSITVTDSPLGGARFTLTLPRN